MLKKSLMAVLLTSMLLLAGCTTEEPEPVDDTTEDPVEVTYHDLTVWHSYADGDTEGDAFANVMAAFEAANPNYNITLVFKPFDDMPDAFVTASLGGEAPDVVRLQNDRMGGIAANMLDNVSIIESLNNYLTPAEKAIYGSSLGGMTANGDILGLPQSGDSVSLYYNKQVLTDAGVDFSAIDTWDWEAFMAAATASTNADEDTWGLMFPYKSSYQFWAWMAGMGGAIFDENGLPTLSSDATIDAIELIDSLIYSDDNMDGVMLEGSDWGNMETYFKDNKAAFMIQGPWAYSGIEAANIEFGQTVLPMMPSGNAMAPFVGLKGWSVSSSSEDKEGAAHVAKFLSGVDAQIEFAKTAKTLPVSAAALADGNVSSDMVVSGFGAQMTKGFGGPAYAAMGTVWGPADSMLADVFDNGLSPADAARKAQAAIEKANGLDLTVDDDADDDGVTINDGDCNDNDAMVYPGAEGEVAEDGIDTDCNGLDNPIDNVVVDVYLSILIVSTANGTDAAVADGDTVTFKGSWDDAWGITYAGEYEDMSAWNMTFDVDNVSYTVHGAYLVMFNVTIPDLQTETYSYEWGANTENIAWFGNRCIVDESAVDENDMPTAVPTEKGSNCVFTLSYGEVDDDDDGVMDGSMWMQDDSESSIFWIVAEA